MNKMKAKLISSTEFLPFGSIANIDQPNGNYCLGAYPCSFYRDMLVAPIKDCTPPAFSSLKVGKRSMIVEDLEFHSYACEIMMPLDDDMVIHVAPANADCIEIDQVEAFIIPKGVMVMLKAGVWHGAPYPINHDGTVLICLPERVYYNDTKKYILADEEKCLIELE